MKCPQDMVVLAKEANMAREFAEYIAEKYGLENDEILSFQFGPEGYFTMRIGTSEGMVMASIDDGETYIWISNDAGLDDYRVVKNGKVVRGRTGGNFFSEGEENGV